MNIIKEAAEKVALAKTELERLITDKNTSLDERWRLWLEAPSFLKNTTPWIHHFTAFADLAEGEFKINEFERGVLYEHDQRGAVIDMENWDDWLFQMAEREILQQLAWHFEATGSEDEDYAPWENADGKKFTMDHYNAWREEVLAGNIGFVHFDW